MKKLIRFAAITAVLVTCFESAIAQVPGAKVLTLDLAQTLAQEAMVRCRADGFKVTVLVVDALNSPRVLLRDEGATPSTTEIAKLKATSAMLYNRYSGPPLNLAPGAPVPPPNIPGTIYARGGIPIKVADVTIGALSVSGATSGDKDEACAVHAVTKLADRLK